MILYSGADEQRHAPVAQLDRVTDYESVGRGFESLPEYQKMENILRCSPFFYAFFHPFPGEYNRLPAGQDSFYAGFLLNAARMKLPGTDIVG